MPGVPVTLDPDDITYWQAELEAINKRAARTAHPFRKKFPKELRDNIIRCEDGTINRHDAATAELIIAQILIILNENGFADDEIDLVNDWLTSGAPNGSGGNVPVTWSTIITIRSLFNRMTGSNRTDYDELEEIISDYFSPQMAATARTAFEAAKPKREDSQHRLNERQAKKMLREELFHYGQNLMGEILNRSLKELLSR